MISLLRCRTVTAGGDETNETPPLSPDLVEVPMTELADRVRQARDNREAEWRRAAAAVWEMRRRGKSWREIGEVTGEPWPTVRRWAHRYKPAE